VANLQKLAATTVQVSLMTDKGTLAASYTGALLLSVLANAGPVDEAGKNAYLRHTFLVTGRDGYAVALSQGEIDPRYGGEQAILAYAKDGKLLDESEGIRLVVPNDKHGGRAVRDVVAIEVR
jgi:hypothetical protein